MPIQNNEDMKRALCKFILKTDICTDESVISIADILIKNGSMSLAQINDKYQKLNDDEDKSQNKKQVSIGVALLIRHDLVKPMFQSADLTAVKKINSETLWTYLYKFDVEQCILRLSLSRFIDKMSESFSTNGEKETANQVVTHIVKHGSLFKKEIVQLLGNRSEIEVSVVIQQLTKNQYIKGANDVKAQMEAISKNVDTAYAQEEQKAGFVNQRQQKAQDKADQKSAQLEDHVPLILNYQKLLFEEKKQQILDFAKVKLCKFREGYSEESLEYRMFKAILNYCKDNINIQNQVYDNQIQFTTQDVRVACETEGINLAEDDASFTDSFDELLHDPSVKFISQIGERDSYQKTKSQNKQSIKTYTIEWDILYRTVQETLMENIVDQTSRLGQYHVRVLRILKFKGFLNEADISQMSLLPPADTRAIINQLVKEDFVDHHEVPVQAPGAKIFQGSVADGPTQTMFGVNHVKMRKVMKFRIMQTILNLCLRYGELGRVVEITKEFNTLYF